MQNQDNYTYDLNSAPPAYQETTVQIKEIDYDYSNQNDYFFFSIFTLISCGFFLGLPGLIFSVKAREKFRTKKFTEGQINANVARKLNIIGVCMGLILSVIFIYENYNSIINNL